MRNIHIINGNIYITNSEEIKEGDKSLLFVEGFKPMILTHFEPVEEGYEGKKIILTTDQDLDNVQAIDDEFLEWFVKNPSCELVEVAELRKQGNPSTHDSYQIIIPKEETKQIDEKGNPLTYWGGLEEPKQETIEEAAYKNDKYLLGQVKEPSFCYNVFSFKEGAKWQQERMYSNAIEFGKWLDKNTQQREYYPMSAMTMEELFDQFKKK